MMRVRIGGVFVPVPKIAAIPVENLIPVGLLVGFGALSIRSPMWTAISFLLLVISLHVIYKRIRKKCSSFYFSFTLCSLIGSHIMYDLMGFEFMRITYWEYVINIFLFTLTLYMMYRTKIAIGTDSDESEKTDEDRDYNDPLYIERKKLAMAQQQIPSYNYCRRCQTIIPGRDHHCVWLNVCIGRPNRYWFLGCLIIAACWIAQISNIYLNSVCYPVSIFTNGLFSGGADGEGSLTWLDHYGLIPVTCPEAYVKTSVTIGFVISIYGLLVLLFIIAVLIHQLRLLYKGVSYLELKYANGNPKATTLKSKASASNGSS